ncbi:MarR family transcriptional regulator [Streptomyces sp. ERV7]|uniref:MarR family winged helix-turn-helix transcriptional regulator n=1 Tax=Streptomyces sp. ERV7 TaxID=1322334 RepID=UPI0007F505FB|nr:helix-turn-helix domain-containing protein [Streptomyces sp. ERV7]OAR25193.1 MarR family transcriptional regulator [Streptomyces sp. ERV7]
MRRSETKRDNPDLGILAAGLLFGIQRELFARLAGDGFGDLRPQHGAILAFLDAEGSRATDLARRSGQHKQVVGKLVDELEVLGYLRREPDPADRRAKLVLPTERGLAQMEHSDAILADIERRHAHELGADGYAAFKDAFTKVVDDQRHQSSEGSS